MQITTDEIKFPGATVIVSYGKPTEMDKVGCQGMYIKSVEMKNPILFLVYAWLYRIFH